MKTKLYYITELTKKQHKKMENITIRFEMIVKNSNGVWHEKMEGFQGENAPNTKESAIIQANEIIDFFNKTLKEWEVKRELIGIRQIEKLEIITHFEI